MAQTTGGNGQEPTPGAGAETAQRLIVNAQYIKDLSFENPRAPQSLTQQPSAPAVDINVDVNAQNLGPDTYEVVLTVKASAKINDDPLFILELVYGAVVTVRNVPRDMLPSVLLVETPRLLFPFARNIVADATRDGGYPPLMVNPIDFSELLRRSAEQAPDAAANDPPSAG
ncbi:MAG TPA: protein-export chaperone SecB [Stellaceae bacterium]|jgi:preprotein translocase subunit SecB|nr:protein-export chaperone SecB [Stellaceae bacterium]